MSNKIDVTGKSRNDIAKLLRHKRRKDLLDIIARAVALDTHFTAAEISRARKLPKREIINMMRSGELRAHKPTPNRWRASLAAIREWDEATAVALAQRAMK